MKRTKPLNVTLPLPVIRRLNEIREQEGVPVSQSVTRALLASWGWPGKTAVAREEGGLNG